MCFTELHDEELNNDEEDEDEEGHQREQQDATLPPLQACVLSTGFCEENDRASGSLGSDHCGMWCLVFLDFPTVTDYTLGL